MKRSLSLRANVQSFGRRARSHARASAIAALYRATPPFLLISRLIVEGDRLSSAAIRRIECPLARPRDIDLVISKWAT